MLVGGCVSAYQAIVVMQDNEAGPKRDPLCRFVLYGRRPKELETKVFPYHLYQCDETCCKPVVLQKHILNGAPWDTTTCTRTPLERLCGWVARRGAHMCPTHRQTFLGY